MVSERICPACGNRIEGDSVVCERCGQRLDDRTEPIDPLEYGADEPVESPAFCTSPRLTLIKGPQKGQAFRLEGFPATIGRDPACDIFLNNRTVSRQHAIIESMGDRIIVRDNHSLNGTWVDGKVVEEAELKEGTLLQIGTFSMRFSCQANAN